MSLTWKDIENFVDSLKDLGVETKSMLSQMDIADDYEIAIEAGDSGKDKPIGVQQIQNIVKGLPKVVKGNLDILNSIDTEQAEKADIAKQHMAIILAKAKASGLSEEVDSSVRQISSELDEELELPELDAITATSTASADAQASIPVMPGPSGARRAPPAFPSSDATPAAPSGAARRQAPPLPISAQIKRELMKITPQADKATVIAAVKKVSTLLNGVREGVASTIAPEKQKNEAAAAALVQEMIEGMQLHAYIAKKMQELAESERYTAEQVKIFTEVANRARGLHDSTTAPRARPGVVAAPPVEQKRDFVLAALPGLQDALSKSPADDMSEDIVKRFKQKNQKCEVITAGKDGNKVQIAVVTVSRI